MPCGTSSVLSTTPATTSLASHARRYDRTARRPGNDPSTLTVQPPAVIRRTASSPFGRFPESPAKGEAAGGAEAEDGNGGEQGEPLGSPAVRITGGGMDSIAAGGMAAVGGAVRAPQFP